VNNDLSNEAKEAFTGQTNTIRARSVYICVGIFFMSIVYFISDQSLALFFHIIFLIIMSILVSKYDAEWYYYHTKRHLKHYAEVQSFAKQKGIEIMLPINLLKILKYGFIQSIAISVGMRLIVLFFIYGIFIIFPLILNVINIDRKYLILFFILIFYTIVTFHQFFLFLHWKYRIAKKIKEEYGLDYKDLV
jgi:hypothetical protein